jgi:hypothetical protein
MSISPYLRLKKMYLKIEESKKKLERDNEDFKQEFLKVFTPDQDAFHALVQEAKKAQEKKAPQKAIDQIYAHMAQIYKKWLPIEDQLLISNPIYRVIFDGLKQILKDANQE